MRTSSHEVAWVATLLEDLPAVEVLGIRVGTGEIRIGEDHIEMLTLDIHAAHWADALRIAADLNLPEVAHRLTDSERYGLSIWRTWSGWAAEGSHEFPVAIEVTAAELERDVPALFEVA